MYHLISFGAISNSKLLLWSAHGEAVLNQWFSTNFNVEVHAYVKNGKFCVVNNTYEPQKTTVYRGDKSSFDSIRLRFPIKSLYSSE